MAITSAAMKAYNNALQFGEKLQAPKAESTGKTPKTSFADAISDSLGNVNKMQEDKERMIEAFASGENQNVHELMISLQKAGVAMSMTNAVRGKVMEAYKELIRMQF